MSNVLYFPRQYYRNFTPAKLHTVRLRVVDGRDHSYTRWKAQYHVQKARGFPALRGFTDANAHQHRWHSFQIAPKNLSRFTRGIQSMANRGLLDIRIDGKLLQPSIRRRA